MATAHYGCAMPEHINLYTECRITYTTGEGVFPAMYALMHDQMTLLSERLSTYPTGVWLLPNMYELMHDQMTRV